MLVLRLTDTTHLRIVAHALDDIPLEACGLLAGRPGDDKVERVYRCRNAAESSRQLAVAAEQKGSGDLGALLRSNGTWSVV